MRDRIKKVIRQVLQLENVEDTASQATCLEWDSLRHLDIVLELELEFDVSFEPEEMAKMTSVEAIEQVIKTKLQ
ncbi:MAG: acyl carrier protein [Bacteroidales bacterium]|jgi:acyl carrier protein|nr:acyl carrier protein [Bacteroidales bacterium]